MSLYENSWKLYKAATENLDFDYKYYLDFSRHYKTLDLCAGFGRVSNYLVEHGVDVTAVELEDEFIPFLKLNKDKIQHANILDLTGDNQFDRVISPYNSFCLFTGSSVDKFFDMLSKVLRPDGLASISYYHQKHWYHLDEGEWNFILDGEEFTYTFDFSKDKSDSFWLDRFKLLSSGEVIEHKYPISIYDDFSELDIYCNKYGLVMTEIVKHNYTLEPGWYDIIIRKI